MAWWTKVVDGSSPGVKKHKTKLEAGIELRFAIRMGGSTPELCGLYKRDPKKYPDEPNLLQKTVERANRVMAKGRKRRE